MSWQRNIVIIALLISLNISCHNKEEDQLTPTITSHKEILGGETSVNDASVNAFGNAAPNLQGDRDLLFVSGNSIFNRNWVTAPASTEDLDGLGPVFNARSCSACHFKDGRGSPPLPGEEPLSLLVRLSIPGTKPGPDPSYGGQFNHRSILGVDPEGKLRIEWVELSDQYPDGESFSLRDIRLFFDDLAYGPMDAGIMTSPRVAPHMIGLGLLEAITEEQLMAWADPGDLDADGISGKINSVWDVENDEFRVGRFGWKSNQPSVRQQVAGAFVGDIGITSSIFPDEACAENQSDCNAAISGGEPELRDELLDRVVLYSSALAVPQRRNWEDVEVIKGEQLFNAANCGGCHIPEVRTGEHKDIPEFSNQLIRPYTDLLLHDMGDGLADGRPDFDADGNEWRTPPLWGIGLFQTVNGHTNYLHDGRARNLEEAILWHGGEALNSRNYFMNLNEEDRSCLIKFLESL